MSFTSGKTTRDPMPYVNGYGSRLDTEVVYLGGLRLTNRFDPRPEFDHHNPILAGFREEVRQQREADWLSMPSVAQLTLKEQQGFEDATNAQCAHARRVLTKLAALA